MVWCGDVMTCQETELFVTSMPHYNCCNAIKANYNKVFIAKNCTQTLNGQHANSVFLPEGERLPIYRMRFSLLCQDSFLIQTFSLAVIETGGQQKVATLMLTFFCNFVVAVDD